MLRRKSRELCLQILFQREFNQKFDLASSVNYFKVHHKSQPEVLEFAHFLAQGVIENTDKIDSTIKLNSKNWSPERMSSVDLNIIRMAIFEGLLAESPNAPKVVLNEAIEIAKKYSAQDASAFINGLLDQVFKAQSSLRSDEE